MELLAGIVLLGFIALFVGALNRRDNESGTGKEIQAEQSPIQNAAENTGNAILVYSGIFIIAAAIIIYLSGG